jgi:hypothetical protein
MLAWADIRSVIAAWQVVGCGPPAGPAVRAISVAVAVAVAVVVAVAVDVGVTVDVAGAE